MANANDKIASFTSLEKYPDYDNYAFQWFHLNKVTQIHPKIQFQIKRDYQVTWNPIFFKLNFLFSKSTLFRFEINCDWDFLQCVWLVWHNLKKRRFLVTQAVLKHIWELLLLFLHTTFTHHSCLHISRCFLFTFFHPDVVFSSMGWSRLPFLIYFDPLLFLDRQWYEAVVLLNVSL